MSNLTDEEWQKMLEEYYKTIEPSLYELQIAECWKRFLENPTEETAKALDKAREIPPFWGYPDPPLYNWSQLIEPEEPEDPE